MSDTTLTDIAQQLKDIADSLMKLSQNIVDTHNQLGEQLQQISKPVDTSSQVEQSPTSKQGA